MKKVINFVGVVLFGFMLGLIAGATCPVMQKGNCHCTTQSHK